MNKEKKENKIEKVIKELPMTWFTAFISSFIILTFVQLGYLIYKTTGVGSFFLLNILFVKVFIFGFLYLLALSVILFLVTKKIVPILEEKQRKRKKEFFEELSKAIKKELKLKK